MTEPAPVFASGVDNERLNAQLRFLLEVDKLKRVLRRNLLVDGSRRENSAEHSWHLTLCARTFAEYAPEGTDIDRVIEMFTIHDIVEIDAEDPFVFEHHSVESRTERERAAADRIFPLLPPDQAELARELWEEFAARRTSEARFARAVDRLAPMLANWHNEGGAWVRFGATRSEVMSEVKLIAEGSSALGAYATALVDDADRRGYFKG